MCYLIPTKCVINLLDTNALTFLRRLYFLKEYRVIWLEWEVCFPTATIKNIIQVWKCGMTIKETRWYRQKKVDKSSTHVFFFFLFDFLMIKLYSHSAFGIFLSVWYFQVFLLLNFKWYFHFLRKGTSLKYHCTSHKYSKY